MNVSALTPKPESKIQFSLAHLWKTPEESGCYVITNYDGMILYVGQAVNIHNRIEQHLKDPKKTGQTPYGKAFWFYYQFCPKIELNDLERGWVHDYRNKNGERPFFNKTDPPT